MIFHLENNHLKIAVDTKGAELKSIFSKANHQELLWQADPEFWGKSSPGLFPIVGTLKNGIYSYEGKEYQLPRHGFARDYLFKVDKVTDTQLIFSLESSEETLKVFPFIFKLQIIYILNENSLQVAYNVKNFSDYKDMYFSLGVHPAFKIGKTADDFKNYSLLFNNDEELKANGLNNGLLTTQKHSVLLSNQKLQLDYKLFENDALVLLDMQSDEIALMNDNDETILNFKFKNFPYFGLWTIKDSGFICLEPWAGISDFEAHNQQIQTKAGINILQPKEHLSASWTVIVP